MLKEVVRQSRATSGNATQTMLKDWLLNEAIQDLLIAANNGNLQPRKLQFISLYQSPDDMWESSLAMYGNDGLVCKSHGEGTEAKHLTFAADGSRIWSPRVFNDTPGCIYRECPDFMAGKCKPIGLLKVHPIVDMEPNPYRFETRSINTIIGVESQLHDLFALSRASHAVKAQEQGNRIPFEGLFGAKLEMRHRKMTSGGREVFITDIVPSKEFAESLMVPIRRGIERNNVAALSENGITTSMLENSSQALLESTEEEAGAIDALDTPVSMDVADEQAIATQFNDPEEKKDESSKDTASPSAAEETLLET